MSSRSLCSGRQSRSRPSSCCRTRAASSVRNRMRPWSRTLSGSLATGRDFKASFMLLRSPLAEGGSMLVAIALLQAHALASPRLIESSGVAVSHAHPGVLWSHNDSGDGPYLYATDTTGADGGHDVEAIYVSPNDTALYLVSKGRSGPIRLYRLPRAAWTAGEATATLVERLPITPDLSAGRWVTGAAMRADGERVAIRTYTEVYFFTPIAGGSLTRLGRPCSVLGLEPQGEAVAFLDDETLVLTSEAARGPRASLHVVRCHD